MRIIVVIALCFFAVASCKKEITQPNSGIYRGTFFQLYDNGDTGGQGIAYIALSEEGGSFSMSGDSAAGAPYDCYGDYVIDDETHITFRNKANVTVGSNPHFILDTTYTYTFDDHLFWLDFRDDTTRYEYRLTRN